MVGLLSGKRAVLVISSGRLYGDQPMGQAHAPYLTRVLEFLGIGPIHVVRAEGLDYGDDARTHALAAAHREIEGLFAAS
jgi:FMN-dependent NADH-azoreductase